MWIVIEIEDNLVINGRSFDDNQDAATNAFLYIAKENGAFDNIHLDDCDALESDLINAEYYENGNYAVNLCQI